MQSKEKCISFFSEHKFLMLYFVSPQVALESQTTYAMASSCFTVAFMTKAAISAAKALGFDIKHGSNWK